MTRFFGSLFAIVLLAGVLAFLPVEIYAYMAAFLVLGCVPALIMVKTDRFWPVWLYFGEIVLLCIGALAL